MNQQALLSLVAQPWRNAKAKEKIAPAIGVQSDTRWEGPGSVQIDEDRFSVAQCDSVLQVRELLVDHRDDRLIFVTQLDLTELGSDVAARILRQHLFRIDPWLLLRDRFNARSFDIALRNKKALAEAAAESLGTSQPDPAPAGVLTLEAVWRLVLGAQLGIADARADARAWQEWTADPDRLRKWGTLTGELQELLSEWMTSYLGEWAAPFLGCLQSGHGGQAMAIGFALGVLRQEASDTQDQLAQAQARARLERLTGGRALSAETMRTWAEAAEQWASACCIAGRTDELMQELAGAEAILQQMGAFSLATLSDWLPSGFSQRLEAFSASVAGFVEEKGGAVEVERALGSLNCHQLSRCISRQRALLERARMAARLCRRLAMPDETPGDWGAAVNNYIGAGAWVDWARQSLIGGDEPESVARRWNGLAAQIGLRRQRENIRFSKHLAQMTAEGTATMAAIPVEDLLERVVAPWAKEKVLLVVMDGMSYAVWHELQHEIPRRGFQSRSWQEGIALPPALAAVPSITGFSRCSLLTGRLTSGGQDVEKRGFAENKALLAVSKASFPPVLFHKDEVGSGAHDLSAALRRELRNDNRRVVGAVINVIDDSLTGPEQRLFHWTLEQIPILATLLHEAEETGRTVIVTSDHGHVLDRGTTVRRMGNNDRYRPADSGSMLDDEVLIQGRRVLESGGKIVALASEGTRYSSNRKVGYHGGVTPQECLVPVAVLAPASRQLEGWFEANDNPPLWWLGENEPAEPRIVRKTKAKSEREAPLFAGVAAVERDWIGDLLRSEVFTEQLRLAGGRLEAGRIERTIRELASRNGVLMKAALAQRLEMPLLRIDGYLSNLQRVLNVDGYPVVSVDTSQTVRLDIDLLRRQFEVTG